MPRGIPNDPSKPRISHRDRAAARAEKRKPTAARAEKRKPTAAQRPYPIRVVDFLDRALGKSAAHLNHIARSPEAAEFKAVATAIGQIRELWNAKLRSHPALKNILPPPRAPKGAARVDTGSTVRLVGVAYKQARAMFGEAAAKGPWTVKSTEHGIVLLVSGTLSFAAMPAHATVNGSRADQAQADMDREMKTAPAGSPEPV